MILNEIAEKTQERVAAQKQILPLDRLRNMAESLSSDTRFLFEDSLRTRGVSFICEVKKASPSRGVIAEKFPFLEIAMEYEKAGASAVSCLTEPFYFKGSNEFLKKIVKAVTIPVLRKDFTVDEYMIYEAKVLGASAVLLICAILTDSQLRSFISLAHELGLSALVEAHTQEEVVRAAYCGARIIGVNNRNLKTFEVDITTAVRLRRYIPDHCLYIAESGIRNAEDIKILHECGTDAVLIGETLMRAPDKRKKLEELRRLL